MKDWQLLGFFNGKRDIRVTWNYNLFHTEVTVKFFTNYKDNRLKLQ